MYRCPVCAEPLRSDLTSLRCANAHVFDRAREGYVNLLIRKPGLRGASGDDADMIRARRLFLDGGDYDPLRAAILQRLPADPVLDVGCGEGYYSRPLASRTQWVGGIDLSKYAVRIAARRERRVNYAVANAFDLPIVTGSIGSIINVFGPVAQTELRRVLRRGGRILAAGPGPNHLIELKQVALDDVALHPLRGPLGLETFRVVDRQRITYEILVRQPELNALLTMTPYRWRTTPRRASAVAQIQEMTITADFLLYTYIS